MTTDDRHLSALRAHWKRHKAFPPMAKLCDVLGLYSTSSVFAAVGRLTEAGYLEPVDGRIAPTKKFFARPVLGTVRAGLPQPTTQEPVDFLTLDDLLIDDPNRTSLHRVRGESMRDVGILEGDLVVVEHNAPTEAGDMVIACVDNELSVRTLRRDARGDFLERANAAFKPIRPRALARALGLVTGGRRRRFERCGREPSPYQRRAEALQQPI